MHSYHRSLCRNGILSGAVLLALVLASCVPVPPTPAASTTGSPLEPGPTPAAAATGQTLYADPAGRFTVPVPINWRVESAADFVVLRDPEDAIKVYVVGVPGGDAVKAIADAWAVADPAFSLAATATSRPPSTGGIDENVVVTYDAGAGRVVKALGQRVKDQVVVLLFDAGADAVERRNSQLAIIQTGLILGAPSGSI